MAKYNTPEDIKALCVINPETGCWEWHRACDTTGYGRMFHNGRVRPTHRVVYEMIHGVVDPKWHIDHLCRNRFCCNPEHLEAVTHRENLRRGNTFVRDNLAKTHCLRGHPLFGDNLRMSKRGERLCIACARMTSTKQYHKRKEENPEAYLRYHLMKLANDRKRWAAMTIEQRRLLRSNKKERAALRAHRQKDPE